jgi:hypothetical protein
MTPRSLLAFVTVLLAAGLAFGACGGGDDDEDTAPGNLTNPRQVPTATPWASPPEVVIIDPNAIQPLPPVGPPPATPAPDTGAPTPSPAAGTCGTTYTVVSGDSPSTIADKCGLTTQSVLDANPGLDPRNLRPGDTINLPQP